MFSHFWFSCKTYNYCRLFMAILLFSTDRYYRRCWLCFSSFWFFPFSIFCRLFVYLYFFVRSDFVPVFRVQFWLSVFFLRRERDRLPQTVLVKLSKTSSKFTRTLHMLCRSCTLTARCLSVPATSGTIKLKQSSCTNYLQFNFRGENYGKFTCTFYPNFFW